MLDAQCLAAGVSFRMMNAQCLAEGVSLAGVAGAGVDQLGQSLFFVKFSIFYESMISRSEKESPIVLFSKSSVYV